MKVNILEAKTRLSELIRAAQSGEEVIIANRGEPVARLEALGPAARKPGSAKPGTAGALLDWLKANPLPDSSRRTAEEIDRSIQEERDSWD